MLNEGLFDDKDKKIAKLKKAIESFKKYDSDRKKYYAESLIELGQLKEYIAELEDEDKKVKKIKQQRVTIANLEKIISANRYLTKISAEQIRQINILELQKENIGLKERNKILSRDLKRARESISLLCSKLSKYENEIN